MGEFIVHLEFAKILGIAAVIAIIFTLIMYLVFRNNRVVKYIGAIDDNVEDAKAVKEHYLENAIAALEKGEEPTPNTTKAIGCTIKVKK